MNETESVRNGEMAGIVAEGQRGRPKTVRRTALGIVLLLLGLAALPALRVARTTESAAYHTEKVSRGDLTVFVSANGTLQPTNKVDVGSEVSGLVEAVLVEENGRVKSGQVLARLDVTKLHADVVNARAALSSAQARVLQTQATVKEATANLIRLRQISEQSGGMILSKSEMETGEATAARAIADEASSKAAVEQARAALSSAETTLSKASIRSPVNGIVLSRKVEPGQTVAASFQAPVLFTLAEDLSQMELQVDVDEADVGNVHEGQAANFRVDAYPHRKYPAVVTRVGYGSQTKDGVVSYKTILAVDNGDISLRPGMTATAEITTVHRSGVLLVPNSALRFTPPAAAEAPENSRGLVSSLLPRPPGMNQKNARPANGKANEQTVYTLSGGRLFPIPVSVGASDGRLTEVTRGALSQGTAIVTEVGGGES